MKYKRALTVSMLSLLLLCVIVILRINSQTKTEENAGVEKRIVVGVTSVNYGTIVRRISVTGALEGVGEAEVISETRGKIVKIDAKVGSFLDADSKIAEVERDLQEISLEQAKAQVAAAQANSDKMSADLSRIEKLYAENAVSESQMENAETGAKAALAQLAGARAAERLARKNYDDTFLRTPIAGRLAQKFVEIGQMINPGTKVATVVDDSRMKLKTGVPEEYISMVKQGSDVEIMSDAVQGRVFPGKVRTIALKADPQTRTFQVEVELPNDDGRSLKSGMFARAEILTSSNARSLVIPVGALVEASGDIPAVYVVKDSVASLKRIKLGDRNDSLVGIVSGLAPGDLVVSFGQQNLVDGARVRYSTGR